jgi:uncharacterized protein YebE (UPF0316 family)
MENIFILAGVVSVIFFLCKFIEMRFILKEVKPLKFLIRESLHVYISVVIGLFIANQFDLMKTTVNTIAGGGGGVNVFVDNPDF